MCIYVCLGSYEDRVSFVCVRRISLLLSCNNTNWFDICIIQYYLGLAGRKAVLSCHWSRTWKTGFLSGLCINKVLNTYLFKWFLIMSLKLVIVLYISLRPGNKTHTNCFDDLYCKIQVPRVHRTALLRRAVLYALGPCILQYRYQTS